jgi:hypothetical protein
MIVRSLYKFVSRVTEITLVQCTDSEFQRHDSFHVQFIRHESILIFENPT